MTDVHNMTIAQVLGALDALDEDDSVLALIETTNKLVEKLEVIFDSPSDIKLVSLLLDHEWGISFEDRHIIFNGTNAEGLYISDYDLQIVCDVVSNNKNVTALDIYDTNFTQAQCLILYQLLNNSNIKYLTIMGVALNNENFNEFISMLKHNNSIRELYFSYMDFNINNIGEHNFIEFCNYISMNDTITVLSLRHNNMVESDIKYLTEALNTNHTLTEIDLVGNFPDFEGFNYILDLLRKYNTTLKNIIISDYSYEERKYEHIIEEIKNVLHYNLNMNRSLTMFALDTLDELLR